MAFETAKKEYESKFVEDETYICRMFAIVDLGTQEENYLGNITEKQQGLFSFEVFDKDGNFLDLASTFPFGMYVSEKSTLFKLVNQLYKDTPLSVEAVSSFPFQDLLKRNDGFYQMRIEGYVNGKGEKKLKKVFSGLPKTYDLSTHPEPVMPQLFFSILGVEDTKWEYLQLLSPWTVAQIVGGTVGNNAYRMAPEVSALVARTPGLADKLAKYQAIAKENNDLLFKDQDQFVKLIRSQAEVFKPVEGADKIPF
jgi:hypothetical protein